jgi:hypothetical protein
MGWMRVGVVAAFFLRVSFAAAALPPVVVISVTGQVELKTPQSSKWEGAKEGMRLVEGTILSTGFNSFLELLIDTEAVRIAPLTRAELASAVEEGGIERAVFVLAPSLPSAPPSSFLPPPPIGFGRNERIRLTAPAAERGKNRVAHIKDAGFLSPSPLPGTATVVVEIQWP